MHILQIHGLMTILKNISHNALVIRIFISITLSEFSPENLTKVMIISKIRMIDTFSSIFPLIMVLEPISLSRTRSPNQTFGHIIRPKHPIVLHPITFKFV